MQETLVSIIMPVFNAASFVGEAVESVLAQTYQNFELIVVDDGSSDGSSEILKGLTARDSRVKLVQQENSGGAAARNRGVEISSGTYIALLDADDVAVATRIQRQVAFLDAHMKIAVVGGAARHIDATGQVLYDFVGPTSPSGVERSLTTRLSSCLYDPTTMFRREAFEDVGGYREQFISSYDYDLWLRMLPRKLTNQPEVATLYRRHDNQTTHRKAELTLYTTFMAYSSFVARQQGRVDPAEGWDGRLDLERLRSIELDPFAVARLYGGLLMIRKAIAANRDTEDRPTLSELARALGAVRLGNSELRGDVAPILHAANSLLVGDSRRDAIRILFELCRHRPSDTARALSRPLRRRMRRNSAPPGSWWAGSGQQSGSPVT